MPAGSIWFVDNAVGDAVEEVVLDRFVFTLPLADFYMTKSYQSDNYLSDSEVFASRSCRTRVGGIRLDDDRWYSFL